MAFRIIRGALIGTVLGLLIGVGLSGAMYMFNYMRQGVRQEAHSLIADDGGSAISSDQKNFVPALSVAGGAKEDYDYEELRTTLKYQGITGLAKELGEGNFRVEGNSGAYIETEGDLDDEPLPGDALGDNLIRFHVRANSNSDVDLALKYKVRDAVLYSIEEDLKGCSTKKEALEYLTDNLKLIKEIATKTLQAEGYNYAVDVYITNDYFPTRQYGEMVLPAGYYEALRIDIGLANGENFWCLLYPTMCVPVEAGGVVTKDGQHEIEEALTPEQYDKLFVKKQANKEKVEIRFKLWDMIFK